MTTYQNPDDFSYTRELMRRAPKEAKAFIDLKSCAERKDGVVPEKYRELISLAVALTTQCAYCIDVHTKKAAAIGASHEEIAETVFITAALRAGAAVGHGLLALRILDEATSVRINPFDRSAGVGDTLNPLSHLIPKA